MARHFSRAVLAFLSIVLIDPPASPISVLPAHAGTKTNGVVASSTTDELRDTNLQHNCVNIANVATAARLAFQEKQLSELEQRLEHRLAELQTRRQELKELMDRYDAFTNKADDTVIDIYSRMKPESAASQLADLDDESAAAILIKLKPKNSSAILNEMDAFHASLLTKKIVLFSSLKHGDKKR